MPLVFADRVQDVTTSTGTGAITLDATPPTGYRRFASAMLTGDTCYYTIEGGAEWEVGLGTLGAGEVLTRTTVISSSNANSAVNFSAGTKKVFLTAPSTVFPPDIPVVLANATTTAETIIARFQLPPNFFKDANDSAIVRVNFHSGATAGTHTVRIRLGGNGTTADTLVATIGATASVAANSYCEVFATVMATAAGPVAPVRAYGFHRATAAFTGVAAAAIPAAGTFPLNAQNFLSISLQASAASAGTTLGGFIQRGM